MSCLFTHLQGYARTCLDESSERYFGHIGEVVALMYKSYDKSDVLCL